MTFLGIDQSYSGFAMTFLFDNEKHETVVKKFDPKKYGTGIDRLNAMDRWMRGEIVKWHEIEPIEHACMEGYANGAKFGREQAGELGGRVKQVLHDTLPGDVGYPTIVAPTALKKYITGKGAAKKNEILLAVYRKWGIEFDDDNAADSYGLAHVAWDIRNECSTFAYEEEVVDSLRIHTEHPLRN